MNGFLVVLSHDLDDFPLRLEETFHEAWNYALQCSWDVPDDHPFNRDACTPIHVTIVEFVDGKPIKATEVKVYEDERYTITSGE